MPLFFIPAWGSNWGSLSFSCNQNNSDSSSAYVSCIYCSLEINMPKMLNGAWRSLMHLFCICFCTFGQQKPEDPNLSQMADDAITRGGIRGLGSPSYICGYRPYMWHDQEEWATCRQLSILIFQYKSLVHLKCYILIQIPSQSDIWFQRYEQFFNFKNNVKHKNSSPRLACNSKSIFPTSDSFPLIMSHICIKPT